MRKYLCQENVYHFDQNGSFFVDQTDHFELFPAKFVKVKEKDLAEWLFGNTGLEVSIKALKLGLAEVGRSHCASDDL